VRVKWRATRWCGRGSAAAGAAAEVASLGAVRAWGPWIGRGTCPRAPTRPNVDSPDGSACQRQDGPNQGLGQVLNAECCSHSAMHHGAFAKLNLGRASRGRCVCPMPGVATSRRPAQAAAHDDGASGRGMTEALFVRCVLNSFVDTLDAWSLLHGACPTQPILAWGAQVASARSPPGD